MKPGINPIRCCLLLAAGLLAMACGSVVLAQPGGAAPVNVTRVIEREIATGQRFIGTVTPIRRSVVESAVDGRVNQRFVDAGDPVELIAVEDPNSETGRLTGQPLIQMRTKQTEIQIAAAQAELELAKQELEELEKSLPEQIKQADASLQEAEALLKYGEARHQRLENAARSSGTVTEEQLDESLSRLIAARQLHNRAKSAAALIHETREAKLAQARAKVQSRQEELNRLDDIVDKFTVRAPFAGYVVAIHTEVGEWIKQGDPVAEIIELDPVEVNVAVPEEYVFRLQQLLEMHKQNKTHLTANVQLGGLPDQSFVGEVVRIVPQADLRSRTFPVRILVPNPRGESGHVLKSGMLAQVALAVGRKQTGLLIPKDALVLGGQTPVVYVIQKEGDATTVRLAPVEIGAAFGSLIEVRGPVRANEQVVVVGNERLRPGQAVRVAKELPAE